MSQRNAIPSTVLIVDPHEATCATTATTLEREGYTVLVAHDGAAALARFAERRPDCVLLEVRLPDTDGFSVCARLRALPEGPETPILFVTGARDVATFDRAIVAGGDDFLTKPVHPQELAQRIRTSLVFGRTKKEAREQLALVRRQRDDLLRLQLQKERHTAFLVHDLKNPVHAMDLQAQLVQRDPKATAELRETAAQIRAEGARLSRMIMNLLDISKADEGQLAPRLEEVPLGDLVEGVFAELAPVAASRDVKLEAEVGLPTARADPDLLRRVVINLVENAIRYSPAHGRVAVRALRRDATVELRVHDDGRGVPPAQRTKIFEPFVQVENADGPTSRTSRGLGLSFCRSAIEAHGGTITVADDDAVGSTFVVRLPA